MPAHGAFFHSGLHVCLIVRFCYHRGCMCRHMLSSSDATHPSTTRFFPHRSCVDCTCDCRFFLIIINFATMCWMKGAPPMAHIWATHVVDSLRALSKWAYLGTFWLSVSTLLMPAGMSHEHVYLYFRFRAPSGNICPRCNRRPASF